MWCNVKCLYISTNNENITRKFTYRISLTHERSIIYFIWKKKRKSFGNRFILHYRIVSADKRVEFVGDGI